MIATLIPFFLVSRIMTTPWKNGPEFVFQAEANVTLQNSNAPVDTYKMNSKLLCRPKELDSLNCRLEDFVLRPANASDLSKKIYDLEAAGNDPFEVKFDDLGVESLIVSKDITTRRLNVIRSIVRQLTIGADLKDKSDGVYEAQNSSVEECQFNLQISHPPRSLVMEPKAKNQVYRLESLPRLNKHAATDIEIRKKRNKEDCQPREAFVFDNIVLVEDVEKYGKINTLEEDLESSESVITISNIGFRSSTRNEGTTSIPESNVQVKMSESIRLILTNIHPARDELPVVPRPAKTCIMPNAAVEAI